MPFTYRNFACPAAITALLFGVPGLLAQTRADEAVPELETSLTLDLGGGVILELLLIRPGSVIIGNTQSGDRRKPAREIVVAKPFYIGKYEVTQEQWQAVMGRNPSTFKGAKNPVEGVSWNDCRAFLKKLDLKRGGTGRMFSLPTEAQWEFACRAGSVSQYCFGDQEDELETYGWFIGNSKNATHPVGEKQPNAWGLYDMHGNVYEWCDDRYAVMPEKSSSAERDQDSSSDSNHVGRGGSFVSTASWCRSTARTGLRAPSVHTNHYGLRVACIVDDDALKLEESKKPE